MVQKAKSRHKKRRSSIRFFILFILFGLVLLIGIFQFDQKMLPSAIMISHTQAQQIANQVIDEATKEVIDQMNLTTSDMFDRSNAMGEGNITANTILINQFCSQLSGSITEKLKTVGEESIAVPIGTASGISFLANTGPDIHFSLRSIGSSSVNYETNFQSAGINQIHFQIWVHVSIKIQIIHPFIQDTMTLEKKLMLVDTYIKGTVPERYFELSGGYS